jgi:hypothetical protein
MARWPAGGPGMAESGWVGGSLIRHAVPWPLTAATMTVTVTTVTAISELRLIEGQLLRLAALRLPVLGPGPADSDPARRATPEPQ